MILKNASFENIENFFLSTGNRKFFSNNFEEKYRGCDKCIFLEIVESDKIIGGIILHDYDEYSNRIMFTISIAEEWQNRGIGEKALRNLLKRIFYKMGIRRVYIEVYETNYRAIALYKKLGFKREGRLRKHTYKEGKYIDLFMMGLLKDEYLRRKK